MTCTPIIVHPGHVFTITLNESSSTGYRWDLEDEPDPRFIEELPVASYRTQAGAFVKETFSVKPST